MNKKIHQSHTRCLSIPSSLITNLWTVAVCKPFPLCIYIYIRYLYTYKCFEAGGGIHHHGRRTYELLNCRLPLWISELLPICLRLLYSYYHFLYTQRIIYKGMYMFVKWRWWIVRFYILFFGQIL